MAKNGIISVGKMASGQSEPGPGKFVAPRSVMGMLLKAGQQVSGTVTLKDYPG